MAHSYLMALAVLILGAGVSTTAYSQTTTLRYKPQKGETYHFKSDLDIQADMKSDFANANMSNNISLGIKVDVSEVSNQGITSIMTFRDAKVSMVMNDMNIFDGNETAAEELNRMVGMIEIHSRTNELGKMSIIEKMGFSNSSEPMTRVCTESIEQLLREISMEFPDKPLQKGDSWTVRNSDTNIFKYNLLVTNSSMTYTYDGIADTLGVKCARIFAVSNEFNSAGTVQQSGMNIITKTEGT
ncbi:MAG TPA: hypothetical protein VEC36_08435, partial [Patescibacteria group bacterium]|nr:hypothetical protein [Patescibacteria group bacterium]